MKFIVFFAFLATVSATTVNLHFNDDKYCRYKKKSLPYHKCGVNPISFDGVFHNVTSALIIDNEMGVIFYDEKDCKAVDDEGVESLTYEARGPVPGKTCYTVGESIEFRVLCIKIIC